MASSGSQNRGVTLLWLSPSPLFLKFCNGLNNSVGSLIVFFVVIAVRAAFRRGGMFCDKRSVLRLIACLPVAFGGQFPAGYNAGTSTTEGRSEGRQTRAVGDNERRRPAASAYKS